MGDAGLFPPHESYEIPFVVANRQFPQPSDTLHASPDVISENGEPCSKLHLPRRVRSIDLVRKDRSRECRNTEIDSQECATTIDEFCRSLGKTELTKARRN